MKNRILYPFLLIIPKGKPIKQILSSFKISLKRRDKKRLSESSWATQKQIFGSISYEIHNILSFIHIHIVFFTYLREGLYAHRIFSNLFHSFSFFIFRCEVTKKNAYMPRFSSKNFNVTITPYFYSITVSNNIISTKPMEKPMVLRFVCLPVEASGISSSTTT